MNELLTDNLLAEYETLISDLGENATDDEIVLALVDQAGWTEPGARVMLDLAQQYGTSILRNALALAEALGIEDGKSGM